MSKRKLKSVLISVATAVCSFCTVLSFGFAQRDVSASASGAVERENSLFMQDAAAVYNVTPAEYIGLESNSIGTKVTFAPDETVTFSKEITVNGSEKTTLLDFAPHPSGADVNGDKQYTYDLEEVKIRVEKLDNNGEAIADSWFEVVVFTDTEDREDVTIGGSGASDDWTGNGLCGIYAYGPGQVEAGYRHGDIQTLTKLGTPIHFSFYKGGAKNHLILEYDAANNRVTYSGAQPYNKYKEDHCIIREFDRKYDKVLADNKWVRQDDSTFDGFAANDKLRVSVTAVGNEQSKDLFFYQVGGEATVIPVHTPVDKALIIDSENVLTTPEAKLYSVAGLTVTPSEMLGAANAEFKVEAIGQGEGGSDLLLTGSASNPYIAYDASNQRITAEKSGEPIVGEYRFTYRIPNATAIGEYKYDQYSAVFEVISESVANSLYPLTMKNVKSDWTADNRYPVNIEEFAIPVFATFESGMDRNGFDTIRRTFSVYKDTNANGTYDVGVDTVANGYVGGSALTALSDCSLPVEGTSFNVSESGVYFVVYEGADGTGRAISSQELPINQRPQPIVVSATGHSFVDGVTSDKIIDGAPQTISYKRINRRKLEALTLSSADIDFYDYRVQRANPEFTTEISIKNPKGNTRIYDENYVFSFVGTYEITYELRYLTDSGEEVTASIIRVLDVYDDVAPVISVSDTAIVNPDKTSGDSLKYVRATTGSVIYFNEINAYDVFGIQENLRGELTCVLIRPDGTSEDLTSVLQSESLLSVTFDTVGEYSIIFAVVDGAGNSSMLRYEVDVRNEWLNVYVLGSIDSEMPSSVNVVIPNYKVMGVAGNVLSGKTATCALYSYLEGLTPKLEVDNAAGQKLLNLKPGKYYVRYAVQEDSYVHEKLLYFTVVDTTKPTITCENVVESGTVGDKVTLATFAVEDNGMIRETRIVVTLNGQDVNVYDNGFIPDQAGEYVVTYTAIDAAGNSESHSYTVTVTGSAKEPGKTAGKGCKNSVNFGSVAVCGLGLALLFAVSRKRRKN